MILLPGDEPKHHPLATIFPMMEGAEFEALVADIREHGVREPAILFEDMILDGRNRHKASVAAGAECPFRQYEGTDPLGFVLSHNLHRRHLNEAQRAMVAAKLANLANGTNQYGQKVAGVLTPPTSSGAPLPEEQIVTSALSAGQAADLMSVSRSSVVSAKMILAGGTPDEIRSAEDGKVGIRSTADAIRSRTPPDEREKARTVSPNLRGKHPARIERQQADAQLYAELKDALTRIAGLPSAADIAALARKSPNRAVFVDAHLSRTLNWLKDFSDAWSAREEGRYAA